MGNGAAGGLNRPPWVSATQPSPSHHAFAGVQMLNSQNPHDPRPGYIYHSYEQQDGQTTYNGCY
eukprot:6516584-Karenia_brevis.AAC.1